MPNSPDSALDVVGIVDAVTQQLRRRILSGEIHPATAVTEAMVSREYGVARPSAKAAIEQLVATGLLMRTAHRSARVVSIDAEVVRDVYRTRTRLESSALRELALTRRVPDAASAANVELLDPAGEDVPDPFGGSLELYRQTADAISRMVDARMADWVGPSPS